MKKLLLLTICATMTMVACTNKGKAGAGDAADSDSVATDSVKAVEEVPDTTPKPMFVYVQGVKNITMCYWANLEKPKKTKDNASYFDENLQDWTVQDGFRRNAAQYTKLLDNDNKCVGIKYTGEVLKNPDGDDASYGELHGREGIPAAGLTYVVADAKVKLRDFSGIYIALTDSYLASRTLVNMKRLQSNKKLPAEVVKQLEGEYKMKAQRSLLVSQTADAKYSYGILQFKGKYKTVKEYDQKVDKALALEVVVAGGKVYSYPVEGYMDGGMPTWNVDDDGEYLPSDVTLFEAPNDALEMAFVHGAPESVTVGLFYLRDGKMTQQQNVVYHSMIDEEFPLWKKDIAQLQKLYVADDPHENKEYKLCKYRWLDIDEDNNPEIWLRDEDDKHGAFFCCVDGKWKLIATEDGKMSPSFLHVKYDNSGNTGYLIISGAAGGPSTFTTIYEIRKSKVAHTIGILRMYGELSECSIDEKEISNEACQKYLDTLPEVHEIAVWWQDINKD